MFSKSFLKLAIRVDSRRNFLLALCGTRTSAKTSLYSFNRLICLLTCLFQHGTRRYHARNKCLKYPPSAMCGTCCTSINLVISPNLSSGRGSSLSWYKHPSFRSFIFKVNLYTLTSLAFSAAFSNLLGHLHFFVMTSFIWPSIFSNILKFKFIF